MSEYIEREALLAAYDREHSGPPGRARALIAAAPAADVVPMRPELKKAVILLGANYDKALGNPVVRDPLAWALFRTWKATNGGIDYAD